VEGLSGDEALRLMLQTKRAWVRATLRRVGPAAPPEKVAAALARVLTEVRHVVLLLQHCFVGGVNADGDVDGEEEDGGAAGDGGAGGGGAGESGGGGGGKGGAVGGGRHGHGGGGGRDVKVPAADGAPLVFAALHESDPQGTTFTGVSDPAREVGRWVQRTAARGAVLTPPPPSAVADECRAWLQGVAADVAKAAQSKGLLAGVAQLADLAALERNVVAAAANAAASAAAAASERGAHSTNTAAASERACVAVLGRPLDAWAALLEAPHLSRAQELLAEALSHASLRAALDGALASLPAPLPRDTPLQPPPEVRDMWGGGGFDASEATKTSEDGGGGGGPEAPGTPRRGGGSHQSVSASASCAPAPAAVRLASDLAGSMAAAMAAARKDALALGGVVKPGAAVPRGGRLAQLEPFIHDNCHAGVMAVAEFLASRLGALEAEAAAAAAAAAAAGGVYDRGSSGAGGGALAVERALLLAQVAQTACVRAEELSTLLGPAAEWNRDDEDEGGGGAGARGCGAGGSFAGRRGYGAGGGSACAKAAKRFKYGVGGLGDAAGAGAAAATGKLGEALGGAVQVEFSAP
jgi:hypothetical protein